VILVTGATGNAGGAVMRALLDRSEEVRALVRDGSGALPDGVARAVGDLNRPDTLTRHLDGVVGVFLLGGYRGLGQTLTNMRNTGVGRVVLLSSSAAPRGDASLAPAASRRRRRPASVRRRGGGAAAAQLRAMGRARTLRSSGEPKR
jgi:nucleoside-diphosphate-sugar epimerase